MEADLPCFIGPWEASSGTGVGRLTLYPQESRWQLDRGFWIATLVLLAVLRSGTQRKSTLHAVVIENLNA